ncbi:MAG: hypothetical protein KGQ59_06890 [Bdellovibrionales bacterium]|nr:hypothetical protein [Bdellovibrionales bacterium]
MPENFRVIQKDQLKVTESEAQVGRVVKPYEQRSIGKEGFTREKVPSFRGTVNPLAKDSRFKVSDLARPYLPMHHEDQALIESEVRKQVDALAKETFEAAREKGLSEGREIGKQMAYDEVRTESAPLLESLENLVRGFENVRGEIFAANERFLLDLVTRIARKVCLKELSTDQDYIQRLAKAMIEQSGARENIRVRVNPTQIDAVSSFRAELSKSFGDLKNLQIELASEVPDGACVVETDFSSLAASLDSQIGAVHEALVKG